MIFKSPTIHQSTAFAASTLPTVDELQAGPCGLHRASINDVQEHFPGLLPHIYESPLGGLETYEFDVKIHMLFKGMYPCIPNWHCDNVPRGENGKLNYDLIKSQRPMFLWVSGAPTTEFLKDGYGLASDAKDHGELDKDCRSLVRHTQHIPEMTWVEMDQRTPHRGSPATETCWRIFIRATPKEILPARPQVSVVRRHAQVYLPHNYHW